MTAGIRSVWRGLQLAWLALAQALCGYLFLFAVSLVGAGVGLLLAPPAAGALRAAIDVDRRLAGRWAGIRIERPYQPAPPREAGVRGRWRHIHALLADPATWRDLAWTVVNPLVGGFLALLPFVLVVYGLFGMALPGLWDVIDRAGGNDWYGPILVNSDGRAWAATVLGAGFLVLGVAVGPRVLHAHARLTRRFLAPAAGVRVRHLVETRSDAVNTSAAEMRRIERDLHDGAQARLVALGMNLALAEQLLARDPESVREILADTRKASATALDELRDLIRGIHPPVLADRGLGDAVRALAMDSPLNTTVTADLPGRAEAPVESAMYFAVSEALTNAAKHAGPSRVTVDLWHDDGRLRAQVTDDGHGGAHPSRGTGLRGIERRLSTFDGLLSVTSPVGGPTTLTMELPCVLS